MYVNCTCIDVSYTISMYGGFRAQVDQVQFFKLFKIAYNSTFRMNNFSDTPYQVPASLLCHLWNRNSLELIINLITLTLFF